LTIDIKRTDGTGQTTFTYYANDGFESVDGPLAGDKITYHYNALRNLIDITPEQGQTVTYQYDYDTGIVDIDLGRLKSITTGSQMYTYDYAGVSPLMQKITRPNGSYTEYEYNDPLKRLTALINKASTGSLINSFAYTYEKDLIKTETVTNGTIIDNFLEKTSAYVPNAVNQLVSATTAPNPAKVYAYDDDGNMTTGYTPADIALSMTYDAENRLKTAQYNDDASHLFQYSYGGNNLLSEVIKDSSITKYLRSGFLPIQERGNSNAITREYTWGKNLGGGIGGLLGLRQYDQNGQNGRDYSYLYDGKGNVSALINGDQQVVASYAYDPFGLIMKQSGIDQPYTFSTKEAQAGTGQYYYGYRFYDSCSGKWTTRDPLEEEGGLNLYGFVGNNALQWIDPSGQDAIVVNYRGYPVNTGYGFTLPLGHGAVIAVEPDTGTTKYYEYGRYDSDFGQVKQRPVPNVVIGEDGAPTAESLEILYDYISAHYGKQRSVEATYYKDADYQEVIDFAVKRMNDKKRKPYHLLMNNCTRFARDAANAGRD